MDTTEAPEVMCMLLFCWQANSITLDVKNENNSSFFFSSRRKSIQMLGSLVRPETFLHTPFPLLSRVNTFRIISIPHNIQPCGNTLLLRQVRNEDVICILNKSLAPAVDRLWTMAAPSNIMQLYVEGDLAC